MQDGSVQCDRGSDISLDRSAGVRIAVIGGGFSGIATAYYLKRRGFTNFLVFESSSEPGGTWNDNRYPGCEVDIVSHLYCFTFNTNDWTQRFGSQKELKHYLARTVDEFDLRPHFRFGAAVARADWSDSGRRYAVSFADGRMAEFEAVVSCVGFLNDPLIPPGIDIAAYPGLAFHSSRWPDGLRLDGKRVGIVGTGSSAAQLVVEAAKVASAATLFQRSANWVLPKNNRTFTPKQRARYRTRWQYRFKHLKELLKFERVKILDKPDRPNSRGNRRMRAAAEAHLRRALAGRPDLIEKLMPDHPIGAKRAVASADFYDAMRQPNVSIAAAVKRMDEHGLVDADGNRHELDIVILATGFQAANYLSRLKVTGRGGADLHVIWNGEPAAFLGSCVPGFPNFFMLHGPNSTSGTQVFILECQAQFAADCIAAMATRGGTTIEVKQQAFDDFNRLVQRRMRNSVYGLTRSYYQSASGKIVSQWPFSATRFWWMTKTLRRSSMTIG